MPKPKDLRRSQRCGILPACLPARPGLPSGGEEELSSCFHTIAAPPVRLQLWTDSPHWSECSPLFRRSAASEEHGWTPFFLSTHSALLCHFPPSSWRLFLIWSFQQPFFFPPIKCSFCHLLPIHRFSSVLSVLFHGVLFYSQARSYQTLPFSHASPAPFFMLTFGSGHCAPVLVRPPVSHLPQSSSPNVLCFLSSCPGAPLPVAIPVSYPVSAFSPCAALCAQTATPSSRSRRPRRFLLRCFSTEGPRGFRLQHSEPTWPL